MYNCPPPPPALLGRVVELFLARRDQYPDAHHDLRLYWSALKKHGQQAGPHYLSMLRDVGLYTLPSDAALGVSSLGQP